MSKSAEEIRAEIESTRRDLGQDVDALADKVSRRRSWTGRRTSWSGDSRP